MTTSNIYKVCSIQIVGVPVYTVNKNSVINKE